MNDVTNRIPIEGPARPATSAVASAVGLSLLTNIATVLGVVVFGWPPGNVLLLFLAENAVVGLMTVVKMTTAGAASTQSRIGLTLFFCFHFGLFTLVQGVFAAIVAQGIGMSLTWWAFGLPFALIVVRYLVETVGVWFVRDARRFSTPSGAMAWAYPRVLVMQFGALAGMFLVFPSRVGFGEALTALGRGLEAVGITATPGTTLVVALMIVKTLVDLFVVAKSVDRDLTPDVRATDDQLVTS